MATSVLEKRLIHFALRPSSDFRGEMSEADVLTTCLCMKVAGKVADNLRNHLTDEFETPLHWFSLDKEQVNCQDCKEWMHA